jgi:hypothetical protein
MVRKDKKACNVAILARSGNCHRVLWDLARAAISQNQPTLPATLRNSDGSMTVGTLSAANLVNAFFIEKIV